MGIKGECFVKTKRFKSILLILTGLALAGCNEKIYSTDWTSDSEGHWHALLSQDEGGEKKDYAAHTYGDWEVVSEASETTLGKKKQVCTVCEYTHIEDIAMLEHTHKYSTDWSSNETQHWHESTCGHDVKGNQEDHIFGEWIETLPATEETVGSHKKICSVCDYEVVEDIAVLPHTHNFHKVAGVEPTCNLSGIVEHYVCEKCGKTYRDDKGIVLITDTYIPATGQHNMVDGVCTTCGETTSSISYSPVLNMENATVAYRVTGISNKAFLNIVVPKFYNHLPVISIEENAFMDCSTAIRIEVPASITSIGAGAFKNCKALETFEIPDGITIINKNTFDHCGSLRSVDVPPSVVSIEKAFNYCTNLSNFVIPKSVTNIEESAFSFANLCSISVEEGNKVFDSRNNCNAVIKSATNELIIGTVNTVIPTDVISIGNAAYKGNILLKTITIPTNIKKIRSGSFSDCFSLESISLSNGLTSIGFQAFARCISLTSFTLPSSVDSLDVGILFGCDNIVTLNVDENNITYSSLDNNNVIVNISTLTLVQGISTSNIDNPYIKIIGNYAFAGFKSLKTFTCSHYVNSIGKFAFGGCINLKTATFGLTLTTIDMYAFYSCPLLTSIDLPSCITKIGTHAFSACSALNFVLFRSIFSDFSQLGSGIFEDCGSLKMIFYRGETPSDGFNALFPNITILYYSKTQPTNEGNYWKFNADNEPSIWSA